MGSRGLSPFELSRYTGTSIQMIDKHAGHLARESREHAIHLLDQHAPVDADGRPADAEALAGARAWNAKTRR